MGILGMLVKMGLHLANEERKKFVTEKELVSQLEGMSNKELKAHMRPFADYQLRKIYGKEEYPQRMKKAAQSILLERGVAIAKLDDGQVVWGKVTKK